MFWFDSQAPRDSDSVNKRENFEKPSFFVSGYGGVMLGQVQLTTGAFVLQKSVPPCFCFAEQGAIWRRTQLKAGDFCVLWEETSVGTEEGTDSGHADRNMVGCAQEFKQGFQQVFLCEKEYQQ